jgi:hypothetical protein
VKLLWMSNALNAQNVVWGAQLAAITPNADLIPLTGKTWAAASTVTTANNTAEARRVTESLITLANLDSVAAGDLVLLRIYRDAPNGSDTLTVDAELIAISFEYTTVSSSTIATILLPLQAAIPSDATALNFPPKFIKIQGTEANPKKHVLVAAFDGVTNANHLWWAFRWPDNYSSNMTLKLIAMSNGVSGSIWWTANFGAISPGGADTPVERAMGSSNTLNAGVSASGARIVEEASFAIGDINSAIAGSLVFLHVWRDPAFVQDTATQEGELIAAALTYTKT